MDSHPPESGRYLWFRMIAWWAGMAAFVVSLVLRESAFGTPLRIVAYVCLAAGLVTFALERASRRRSPKP